MLKDISHYWLGTPDSVSEYVEAIEKSSDSALELEARSSYDDDDDQLFLLDIDEGVATITIKGPLITYSNEFTRWLGITGYPDIRNALIEAAQDTSVAEILLNIDSPGGAAKGIEDVSALIQRIDKEYKPVTAYTNGTMASAAYWIATSARKIISSKMAEVGSIGVIATHMERSKMLKERGITVTELRAGEFKALGGPYVELSDTAKEIIQSRLDTLYAGFIEQVAKGRNVSEQYVKQYMAEGREFLGFEAKEVNMVDEIMSIDEITHQLRKSASGASNQSVLLSTESTAINKETEMAKQKVLDDKTVAVLAAGGDVQETLESAADDTGAAVETEASTQPTEDVGAGSVSSDTESEGAGLSSDKGSEGADLASYLKTELAAAQDKVADLTVQNKELNNKIESMSATHNQLKEIAQDFSTTRAVALGRPAMDLSNMSDEATIQHYNAVTEDFHKTFPVGGKCSLPSTEEPAATVVPSQNHASAVKAARV